jgi:hypothetical protein
MIDKRPRQSEEPRSEPEIIPPDHAGRGRPSTRVFPDSHSAERIYIGKPGPLGTIVMVLIAGLLSAAMLIMLLGAFLIFLPAVILFVTAAIVVGLLRIYFQRAP